MSRPRAARSVEIRMQVWPAVKDWRIFERVRREDFVVLEFVVVAVVGFVVEERVKVAVRGARDGWRRERRRERRWADSVERVKIRTLGWVGLEGGFVGVADCGWLLLFNVVDPETEDDDDDEEVSSVEMLPLSLLASLFEVADELEPLEDVSASLSAELLDESSVSLELES